MENRTTEAKIILLTIDCAQATNLIQLNLTVVLHYVSNLANFDLHNSYA